MAGLLPRAVRYLAMRRMVNVTDHLPEGVTLKIAETQDELEQAFRLLHDRYVEYGFMDPHPSGMRITKYHALPSTTTLIAVKDGEVIATFSLIRSSALGLPCDLAYDLEFLKKKRARIIEGSGLAIKFDAQHTHGAILWPLLKFVYIYAMRCAGADYIVQVVQPKWFTFYEGLLFFKKFSNKKIRYAFVKGTKATGGYLNLRHFKTLLELTYDSFAPRSNLYRYFDELTIEGIRLPSREMATITDPVMTPRMLKYFFTEQSQVFLKLNDKEKIELHRLYPDPRYIAVLPPVATSGTMVQSPRARLEVETLGYLRVSPYEELDIKIRSVSEFGIGTLLHRPIRFGYDYTIRVQTGRFKMALVTAHLVWNQPDGSCGFVVIRADSEWREFVRTLELEAVRVA